MFLENKYTKIYYQIIDRAVNRNIDGYSERHHIIPKSLGGSNAPSNLVDLTAREHFVCHWLLVKMTTKLDRSKMAHAFRAMGLPIKDKDRYISRFTSRIFEYYRKEASEYLRTAYARMSPETKAKISTAVANANRNRIFTEETLKKRSASLRGIKRSDEFKKLVSLRWKGVKRGPSKKRIAKESIPKKIKPLFIFRGKEYTNKVTAAKVTGKTVYAIGQEIKKIGNNPSNEDIIKFEAGELNINAMRGRVFTDAERLSMSIRKKELLQQRRDAGLPLPNEGSKYSAERRAAISASKMGKPLGKMTQEHKDRISKGRMGLKKSKEEIEKREETKRRKRAELKASQQLDNNSK